jgi:hypothetical protein
MIPKLTDFEIEYRCYDPDAPPVITPQPIIPETKVVGLPETLYKIYNVGDVIDLSLDPNVVRVTFSNPKMIAT